MAFETGKKFRYIPAHEIASALGPDKSQALPYFMPTQAVTQFPRSTREARRQFGRLGRGHKEVTSTSLALSDGPTEITEDQVAMLERFTIILYNCTSS